MFAVGGGERSATTSERLVGLECLPTTLQVLFGLILDDGETGKCPRIGPGNALHFRSFRIVGHSNAGAINSRIAVIAASPARLKVNNLIVLHSFRQL
jgi:hypothetical protein